MHDCRHHRVLVDAGDRDGTLVEFPFDFNDSGSAYPRPLRRAHIPRRLVHEGVVEALATLDGDEPQARCSSRRRQREAQPTSPGV